MAFCVGNGTAGGLCSSYLTSRNLSFHRQTILFSNPSSSSSFSKGRSAHITCARKFSSRTGRFDSKNKRSGGATTTTTKEEEEEEEAEQEGEEIDKGIEDGSTVDVDDGYFLPELPGDKPDFWEGPKWDALGFFVQYMWAFGIGFALIACGIAVATYNEGATDFKQTPVYKESIQSRELLEEPEASNSDVFEANPTEEAPSLE
ncbi:uncharacterized protein LOC122081631 [Macadamia integrifolia]|uniref:uncharacterized protein LOC122081631 n=1 Tax=Macadamia integrifolia TaxID=60698 RepID=UPI001C4E4DC7|nr:uncharacterized protein LOC122081631 [Macadamia integrifolia]